MDSSAGLKINSPTVVQDTIDGEVVIVNLKSGSYYSLDRVGGDIWNLLEQGGTVGGIVDGIVQKYDGTRSEIENAIHKLVKELQEEELVVSASQNNPGRPGGNLAVQPQPGAQRPRFVAPTLQKYTDMQDLLLLDPIHDVDDKGWPTIRMDKPPQ
jgi:hypothetical protein